MADFTLPVLKIKQQTPDVVSVLLDVKGQNIPYQAGQFFRLTLSNITDPRGPWRFFSNCASPTEHDFFMFTTTISQSSFKQKIKTLTPGESISVSGPFGKFVLGDNNRPYVFLSGGIGITPFRSIVKYATDEKLPHKITLLYSNSVSEEIIFKEDLDQTAKDNPNVKIIYTITKPEESSVSWHGKTGRIDEKMIQECTTDIANTLFYICGPPSMVDALSGVVKGLGVADENIKTERFTGYP